MDVVLVGPGVVAALLLVAGGASVSRRETGRRKARLAVIERKLDAVLDRLGVDVPRPELGEVEDLVARSRTAQAVKAYREATGAGLLEAKQAVDRLGGRA